MNAGQQKPRPPETGQAERRACEVCGQLMSDAEFWVHYEKETYYNPRVGIVTVLRHRNLADFIY